MVRGGGALRRLLTVVGVLAWMAALPVGIGAAAPEAERPTMSSPSPAAEQAAVDPEIDIAGVVEQVEHHVHAGDAPGELVADDPTYSARFTAEGFRLDMEGGDLTTSTRAVGRASALAAVEPGTWEGNGNVATRALLPGVTERVTARTGEVEWDVVLQAPPTGEGDFVVEADLRGTDGPPRLGEATVHLPLAGGGSAQMGEVVVFDVAGRELHRSRPSVTGDVVRLTVPGAALEGARYPVTVDPTVSGERGLHQSRPGEDRSPAVAAVSGGTSLVAWVSEDGVTAARVSSGGSVLDPGGLAIDSFGLDPVVAWNGSRFLVVWELFTLSGAGPQVFAATVTPGGVVSSPAAVATQGPLQLSSRPAVAPMGSGPSAPFRVLFIDDAGGPAAIYARTISGAGVPGDPAVPIPGVVDPIAVDLAWNGSTHLVAWASPGGDTDGFLLNPAGAVTHIGPLVFDGTDPAVANAGSAFLVAATTTGGDVRARQISGTGVLTPSGTDLPIATGAGSQDSPDVASNGSGYAIAWHDGPTGDVRLTRTNGAGTSLGSTVVDAGPGHADPTVGWNGSNYLVSWVDGDAEDVVARRVKADGAFSGSAIRVSTAVAQSAPALASDGSTLLVVWEDRSGPAVSIRGTAIAANGTVLAPAGFAVSTGASDQLDPAIAYNPDLDQALVVWEETDGSVGVAGRILTADGPLGPGQFIVRDIANRQGAPAVASSAAGFMVAWEDNTNAYDIRARRVYENGSLDGPDAGTVADPVIDVRVAAGAQRNPSIAHAGGFYLVAWDDTQGSVDSTAVKAVRVAAASLGPIAPVAELANTTLEQQRPVVGSDGTTFLVAWEDRRVIANDFDIYGARVSSANGQVLPADAGGRPISQAPDTQRAPAVAHNGSFLVAWRDGRNGSPDIFAGRVAAADFTRPDGNGFAVSTVAGPEDLPALAPRPGGSERWWIGYERPVSLGTDAVYLRTSPK